MTTYNQTFYDTIRAGVQSSAATIVPRVHKLLVPESVVDVGCGEGWWAQAFKDLGCEVVGIDADAGDSPGFAPDVPFIRYDVTRQLTIESQHDLVVCLEVAEHLPSTRAVSFIEDMTRFQPKAILFSAAIPGQSGAGHINCQWQAYWAALIEAHGYRVTGALRWSLWDDPAVEPWYKQNLLLGLRNDVELKGPLTRLFDPKTMGPLNVVHPEIWGWFR